MRRAIRRHHAERLVKRRWADAKAGVDCGYEKPTPREFGRWRKTAPFDCGRPKCSICQGGRHREGRSARERRALREEQEC